MAENKLFGSCLEFLNSLVNMNAMPIPLVKVAMPPRETLMPALEAVLYSGMVAEGTMIRTKREYPVRRKKSDSLCPSC